VPTGSPAAAITIGMSLVACFTACTAGVCDATITSGVSRTSSCAKPGSRLRFPPPERTSTVRFCPSTYPRSCSPCLNTRKKKSLLPTTRIPMRGSACARAASGHAAAAPPSSDMNSRRFMSNNGLPPSAVGLPHAQPTAKRGGWVLGGTRCGLPTAGVAQPRDQVATT
jgi:hypothetical protein